jgi:hypothetical protein
MSKLNKVENQIKAMIQWITVHYVGQQHMLDKIAEEHGLTSNEFSVGLKKYFSQINKHNIELETLEWVLREIENVRKEE